MHNYTFKSGRISYLSSLLDPKNFIPTTIQAWFDRCQPPGNLRFSATIFVDRFRFIIGRTSTARLNILEFILCLTLLSALLLLLGLGRITRLSFGLIGRELVLFGDRSDCSGASSKLCTPAINAIIPLLV